MRVFRWREAAIRAGDFAGLVPASRGAPCRPLHPRLASLCSAPRGRPASVEEPAGPPEPPRPLTGSRPPAR
jgi:hypothetical protein